jgi:uncharacterized protein YukJ
MNQGNPPGRHERDNGVWQDGALLLHFPAEGRWTALFLAFQSQRWHVEETADDRRHMKFSDQEPSSHGRGDS